MNEAKQIHRCHACMNAWTGENRDPDNRCPPCVQAGREVPGWFKARVRSLRIQGRQKASA